MRKRDFVVAISNELGLIQANVSNVIQRFLDMLEHELANGNGVELRNFGIFELKKRKSRVGRNPNKPQNTVIIPDRFVVKFRPGKELKGKLEQLSDAKLSKSRKKSSKNQKKTSSSRTHLLKNTKK